MKTLIFTLLFASLSGFAFDPDGLDEAINKIDPQFESLSLAMADAQWTHDDMFEGKVVIFSAKAYLGMHEEGVDEHGYKTQYYVGTFSNETQFGDGGLELSYLKVAAIDVRKVKELESNGRLQIIEAGAKLGNMQISRDVPLAQRAYVEVEPVRIYGTVGWSPESQPEIQLIAKAQAALGYARAWSTKDYIDSTSNFYTGYEWGVGISHARYGQVMLERGVDGDSQKYDDGAVNSREAVVRFSYSVDVGKDKLWNVGFAAEKRSFRFGSDYEKGKRYIFQFTRKFK